MKVRFRAALVAAGLVVPFGCGSEEETAPSGDARVDIVLDAAPDALGADATTHAYLAITSVEIVPCPTSLGNRLRRAFAIASAHAHESTTPTRLGVSFLAPLGASGSSLTVGAIAPPRTPFCSVRVALGPADGDAKGMPADRSALGRTLWFVGRTGDAELRLTTTAVRTIELPVPSFVPGSLGRRTVLHLGRSAGNALAGVDPDPDHIAEASALVLDRLVATLAAHTE